MNVPLTAPLPPSTSTSAASSLRAHLLHQLRRELDVASLRRQTADGPALPRPYWQKALGAPLRDFLGRGSKMFRARMTEWSWAAAGGEGSLCMAFPLAVEALHAGSLIIDDIEDRAGFRRGDISLHERYGLAPALNAGNWLYFWPARLLDEAQLPPAVELAALKKLGETQHRCHLGQGLDVALNIQDIHQEDVESVVTSKTVLKTGALMGLSAYLGALGAGAEPEARDQFAEFGEQLGGVLQMLDDAGTITSDHRGEKAREDLMLGTPTWPWAWAARRLDATDYRALIGLAHEVQSGRVDYTFLRQRLRNTQPEDIHAMLRGRLEAALEAVRPVVQREACIATMYREFERLEQSYA